MDEWPAYLAYVTSFLTVGSVWIAHHNLYTHLRYVDAVLLRLNMLLLLVAAFLPFPTAVMAQAFEHSETAERVAVAFYGGTALLIELLLRSAISYAVSKPELTDTMPTGAPAPKPERNWTQAVTARLCTWSRSWPGSSSSRSSRRRRTCSWRSAGCSWSAARAG